MGLKKLYVDMPALLESKDFADKIECEYIFHRKNAGHFSLIEALQFSVYCRRCSESFCIDACPNEALEHLENGMIKRYNMRCVGCKSCILACPFGAIVPEVINYITANCDYCLNQRNEQNDFIPLCVKTAPEGTFEMKEISSEEKNVFFCGDNVAVKQFNWRVKEGRE